MKHLFLLATFLIFFPHSVSAVTCFFGQAEHCEGRVNKVFTKVWRTQVDCYTGAALGQPVLWLRSGPAQTCEVNKRSFQPYSYTAIYTCEELGLPKNPFILNGGVTYTFWHSSGKTNVGNFCNWPN